MPKRARTKSRSRGAYKKRGRVAVYSAPQRTIPDRLRVQMRYCHYLTLNGAVSEASNTFRALSIFDPDFSGIGGQPYGHDSYANLYERYRVKRVKMDAFFQNLSTTAPTAVCLTAHETLASPPVTYQVAVENPTSTMTIIGQRVDGSPTQGKLSLGWFSPEGFKGDPGAKYDQDYQALFGNNPAKDFGLTVFVRNMTGASSVEVRFIIILTYDVELFDRSQQLAS